MKTYLIPEEAADYIRYETQTLANWRSQGKGPDWVKTPGGKILYDVAALDAWILSGVKA